MHTALRGQVRLARLHFGWLSKDCEVDIPGKLYKFVDVGAKKGGNW